MPQISGYSSLTSVSPGETIYFHLSSDPRSEVVLRVERIGNPHAYQELTLEIPTQHEPSVKAWEGFCWKTIAEFRVPESWPTGLYAVNYENQRILTFVIRTRNPGLESKILFQICVNTPQAYNAAGGKSLYGFNSLPSGHESDRAASVSFDRPGGLVEFEIPFIDWLEEENIQVDYCSSLDLHEESFDLSNYNLLLSVGHDEYWSKEMRSKVEEFIRNGGNVAFFSGNTCYRQIRYHDQNRTMVFYKYSDDDPLKDVDNDRVTVAWSQPPVNYPENHLTGVSWINGFFAFSNDKYYEIHFPAHWVFDQVQGNRLGEGLDLFSYEGDAAHFSAKEGYPRVTGNDGSPLTFTVLASADLREIRPPHKPGVATMGIYYRNGSVFNAATTNWAEQLVKSNEEAKQIKQVTKNVILRLRQRKHMGILGAYRTCELCKSDDLVQR